MNNTMIKETIKFSEIKTNQGLLLDGDIHLIKLLNKHSISYHLVTSPYCDCDHYICWIPELDFRVYKLLQHYSQHIRLEPNRRKFIYWWHRNSFGRKTKIRIKSSDSLEIMPLLISLNILEQNEVFFDTHQNRNSFYGFDIIINADSLDPSSQIIHFVNDSQETFCFDIISE